MTDDGKSKTGSTSRMSCDNMAAMAFSMEGIPRYSGDDKTLSSGKWAQDIEDNAEIFSWSEHQKLIIARKSLTGTAALWLKGEKIFKTFEELKSAIQKEFPDSVNTKEMHEILAARKKHADESYYQYMLVMKELGRRAKFADYVTIQYIIDGIQDYEPNKSILYGSTTYPVLKDKLLLYEKMKLKTPAKTQSDRKDVAKKDKKRCYNCGENSHVASSCPNGVKCFRCNKYGHKGIHCTEVAEKMASTKPTPVAETSVKPSTGKEVGGTSSNRKSVKQHQSSMFNLADAATNQNEMQQDGNTTTLTEEETSLSMHGAVMSMSVNKVKINKKPIKSVTVKNLIIDALIDSGSDLNLITCECSVAIGVQLLEDNLFMTGLGQTKVYSSGRVFVDITIDGIVYKDVLFHVVSKDVMPFTMILGQELLRKTTMLMNEGEVTFLPEGCEWMSKLSCFSDVLVDIDHIEDPGVREKVSHLIESYHPQQTMEAPIKLKIVLKDDIPVAQRPRRLSLVEQKLVEQQVKEWLDSGIARVSFSEYSSPLVLVKKKDGAVRVCVDYRLINKKIIKDEFPLPVIEDLIDKLCGVKVYSVMDLKNGFFHLKVSEESIPYTSFVTHHGQFEFLRAPFGLSVCPKYFMRFVSIIFRDLISQDIMMIFIDDILVMANSEQQAVERLELVLDVASKYGLIINWKKTKLIQREIEYLGHIVKDGEIKPSPDKTDAVLKYPEPQNLKQLHSFIGLTSYFRKYIENYAAIAKPLTDLLKKNNNFVFEQEQIQAFQTLKKRLASGPVLKIYDPNLKTELHTDASSIAYSAILLQHHPNTGLHPVHYMSCKTSDTQSRYPSYELEALAIIEGVKKFRHYLYGISFKIVTDCKAFEMTLRKKDLTTKIARWVLFLNEYDFVIEHRAGSKLRHVDALSRHPYVGEITLCNQLEQAQDQDEGLRAIKQILQDKPYEDYWIENNILYKGEKKLLVVPKTMEMDILKRIHSSGHFAKKKMKEIIEKEYYIKGVDKKLEDFIVTCIPCLLATKKAGKQEGFLHSIEKDSIPLDTIHLDHVGPLTQTSKLYNYILTVIDAFTKFVWLFPTKSTSSQETLSKLQIHQQTFGNPRRIITDKGTAFTSLSFAEYCKEENITHLTITTGVPRGNGQVERVHRIIIPLLTKLCIEDPKLWYKHVSRVQRAINCTYQRSINTTPFELLTGTKMRTKEDIKIQELIQEDALQQYNEVREDLRKQAKEQIIKIQEENARNYNKNRKEGNKYQLGDIVAIKRTQFGAGLKLKPRYLGPYKVVKVKRNDRYDVEKLDSSTEGPGKTSSSVDHMKRWNRGHVEEV